MLAVRTTAALALLLASLPLSLVPIPDVLTLRELELALAPASAEAQSEMPGDETLLAPPLDAVQPPPGEQLSNNAPRLAPTEILVKFKRNARDRDADDAVAGEGTETLSRNEVTRVRKIRVPQGKSQDALLRKFESHPLVEWAEPNRWVSLDASPSAPLVPNDSLYATRQKSYYDVVQGEAGWGLHTGSASVIIAVIDSGVACNHTDLSAKMWQNPGEIAGNNIDDDGNGKIDDKFGWDFVGAETGNFLAPDLPGDNNPCIQNGDPAAGNGMDDDGNGSADGGVAHGTMVGGVAAASSNNSSGVAGVCWGCRIMAVRVANPEGWIRMSDAADGITYAAQNGANVINLSYGGSILSLAEKAAIDAAHDLFGAVVVASAGNGNMAPIGCPACTPNAIAVGASDDPVTGDPHGRAFFSNWGVSLLGGLPHGTDVVAPGVSLTSTAVCSVRDVATQPAVCPTAGTAVYALGISGTSFSAPMVSGLAGLIRSKFPAFNPEQVRDRLKSTALNLPDDPNDLPDAGPDWDGAGLIQMSNALSDLPSCTLSQTVSYAGGNITLEYIVGSTVAATAEIYVVIGEVVVQVFSGPFPVTDPPISSGPITFSFPPLGQVGWFAWLTNPPGAALCFDFDMVDTGAPVSSATADPAAVGAALRNGLSQ